jgi:hypothetical protein
MIAGSLMFFDGPKMGTQMKMQVSVDSFQLGRTLKLNRSQLGMEQVAGYLWKRIQHGMLVVLSRTHISRTMNNDEP